MHCRQLTLVESDPNHEQQEILLWMARVDAAFEAGQSVLAEELDATLEVRLDDLEQRLGALDEGGDVLDGDNHAGIEAQFIAFWSSYLLELAALPLLCPRPN